MKSNIYYLFLVFIALLLMSCDSRNITRKEVDSAIEYDVIEIDSCEYIMVQSRTYYGYIVTSIGHKGNCKYCKESNMINAEIEHNIDTDTIVIYKFLHP